MKTIFKSIALIAAVAATFAACSKVEEQQIEQTPLDAEKEYVYTFALGNNPDTKAILGSDANGRFVEWTSGDQLGSITTKSQGYSNITPADGATPATFAIYSKGGLSEGNTINVWFPYRAKYTDPTDVTLLIPNEQEQRSDDNKFDFKAMPMVAKQITVTSEMATDTDSSPLATIDMVCLGSTINFKVFSTEPSYASEKVRRITFNARNSDDSAEAYIAGSFTKNLTTVDPADLSTLTIPSFTTGYSSVVTSPRSASSIGTDKASALDLYMVVAPGSYRGTVVVETDAATYTYNLTSAKELVRAGFKAFGLDLKKAASRGLPVDYVTLPWTYPTGGASATSSGLNSIVGVTSSGLGSDYSDSNKPYQIKFDNTGDYIQVKTNTEISTVSVDYKMIGGGNTSSLDIYESADGETWGSAIDNLVISGSQNDEGTVTTTAEFAPSSRFVRIEFNKGSNVGIGGITIATFGSSPRISASSINVTALGATNALADYEIHNFAGSDDVSVKTYTGCVTSAIIEGGKIKYSVAPNYGTTDVAGTIVLQSDEAADKTVNVSQAHDILTQTGADGSPLTLVIPNDATTAEFDITSAVFGWNASVTPAAEKNLTIKTGVDTYAATHSGSANASSQTITVNSTTAASESEQTLGTIDVYRNGNASDSQKISITIKKASIGGGTPKTFSGTFVKISDASSSLTLTEPGSTTITSTITVTGGALGQNVDGTKGAQVGTGSSPASKIVISAPFTGSVSSITINTSGAKSVVASLEVSVGGTSYKCGGNTSVSLTNTATDYTFTGSASGAVTITITNTSSKAIYLKNLSITGVK